MFSQKETRTTGTCKTGHKRFDNVQSSSGGGDCIECITPFAKDLGTSVGR
jgi:hypothetical protein